MKKLWLVLLCLTACEGGEIPPIDVFPDSDIESEYYQTVACTGLYAVPPLTLIIEPESWKYGDFTGLYIDGYEIVLLKGDQGDPSHEFIHHLLYVNTGDLDACHRSALFHRCSGDDGIPC